MAKRKKAKGHPENWTQEDRQQEDRIEGLKRRAKELSGGAMMESNSDDTPAEVEEVILEIRCGL